MKVRLDEGFRNPKISGSVLSCIFGKGFASFSQ